MPYQSQNQVVKASTINNDKIENNDDENSKHSSQDGDYEPSDPSDEELSYDDNNKERITIRSETATFMKTQFEASSSEFDKQITQQEVITVGAGIGGGFGHTSELIPMKFNETLRTAVKNKWLKAVEEEHECMVQNKVGVPVKKKDQPKDAKF